jgi:CheY-like chemotaxis protein
MLSANAMDQHLTDTEAAGADRHLAKPFSAQGLIQVVGEVVQSAEPREKIAANSP